MFVFQSHNFTQVLVNNKCYYLHKQMTNFRSPNSGSISPHGWSVTDDAASACAEQAAVIRHAPKYIHKHPNPYKGHKE